MLVANEPRSYREVIADAVRGPRPRVEVIVVEPGDLDREVGTLGPDLVLCSGATAAVHTGAPAWIELYPGGETLARIHLDGRNSTIANIQLAGILSIVDQAPMTRTGEIAHPPETPPTTWDFLPGSVSVLLRPGTSVPPKNSTSTRCPNLPHRPSCNQ